MPMIRSLVVVTPRWRVRASLALVAVLRWFPVDEDRWADRIGKFIKAGMKVEPR